MQYPKYTELTASAEFDEFEFISSGEKGDILKKIQFSKTEIPDIYNLGFGDKMYDGTINDSVDSKNGDRDKVLATIVEVVFLYTSIYPERSILFSGSNSIRTRLYRMAISKNYDELSRDFHIFAIMEQGDKILKVQYKPNSYCLGFIVKRKSHLNF